MKLARKGNVTTYSPIVKATPSTCSALTCDHNETAFG